jgi:hypothetical protein
MKRIILLFCALVFTGLLAKAEETIKIPCGKEVVMDGHINGEEWSDANSISLSIMAGTNEVVVLMKHDGEHLNFAFLGNLESSQIRFPEILIDANHSRSTAWESDDWWFHVSATDCESKGKHSDYSTCKETKPEWIGIPNMSGGSTVVDTIEIQIPLSYIGVSIEKDTKIGIAFDVTNTWDSWEFWPNDADMDSPATWATAELDTCPTTSVGMMADDSRLKIYPNPNFGAFEIKVEQDHNWNNPELSIMDINGKVVYYTLPQS